MVARLRHPLWDLTPEEMSVLGEEADAIQRACKLTDDDLDHAEPTVPPRVALFGALHRSFKG